MTFTCSEVLTHGRPINILDTPKHFGLYILRTKTTWENNWNYKRSVPHTVTERNTFQSRLWFSLPYLRFCTGRFHTVLWSIWKVLLVVVGLIKRCHSTEFGWLSTETRFICGNATHSLYNLKNYKSELIIFSLPASFPNSKFDYYST